MRVYTMEDCIVFKGMKNKGGYGYLSYNDGNFLAHRLAWVLDRGRRLASNQVIMHTCDNPPCINPRHLKLGTHKLNYQDMLDKGRGNYLKGGGRPVKTTQAMVDSINALRATGMTAKQACKQIGISRAHYNYRNRIGF
jgi:hypothetical protein